MNWSDAAGGVRSELPMMRQETWKAFCRAAGDQKNGYVMKAFKPLEEDTFKCSICNMVWTTGIPLEGKPHKALKVTCGGMWYKHSDGYEVEE